MCVFAAVCNGVSSDPGEQGAHVCVCVYVCVCVFVFAAVCNGRDQQQLLGDILLDCHNCNHEIMFFKIIQ